MPSRRVLSSSIPFVALLGACAPEAPDPGDPAGDTAVDWGTPPGPGLGNRAWDASDLFQPVGWVDQDNGVPASSDAHPITLVKPFGTNMAYLHDGYMVTVFAPDSGFGPGGLLIHDVSDPTAPELVTRVWEPDEEAGGRTWDFREAHAMGFSWREGRKLVALHTGRGIHLWDLADVHAPELVGRLDLPGVDFGDYALVAWQLAWQGTYLYVAGSGDGVFVVDTSDPTNPVLADRGDLPNPIPPSELGGFRVGPLFTVGNTLLVSSMDNEAGYAVLDLSDPLRPALLSTRTGLPKFYATCFSGGFVYTSVRGGGAAMTIDDVSDPFSPRWRDRSLVIDRQLYCGTQDQFVFQGGEDEVVKVDVSDPDAPEIVGRGVLGRPLTDHGQVSPFGNLVFVGNDHGTGSAFVVHDTAPDTTPPAVSFVSPADGSVSQGLLTRVGVTFTDAVTVRTVSRRTFQVRPEGGEALEGTYTAQAHIVNFEPSEPLAPDTVYEVVIPADGLTDWAGNPTADTFVSSFRTAAVSPDAEGALRSVVVQGPDRVAVGQPVTLSLDVDGPAEAEVSWRLDESEPWVHRDDASDLTHTFDAPGHRTVIVTLTDGLTRVSTTHRLTVHRPLPAAPPRHSRSLAWDGTRDLVWTVNRDNDTVTALDADTLARVREVPVDAGPRSVAVGADGRVWVACEAAGTLLVLDGDDGALLHRESLGQGSAPFGVVLDPSDDRALVTLAGTPAVVALDTTTFAEVAAHDLPASPSGLALSGDGQTVWVTRHLSPDEGAHVYRLDGALTSLETLVVPTDETTLDGEDRARGVPNVLLTPGLTPDEAEVWLPAKQDNILRGTWRDGEALTHETTVRAVVPRIAADDGRERSGRRLDLNDRAPPVDVAFTPLGDLAFLALRGSNRVAVHDAYTGETLGETERHGAAVQGLLVSPDGTRLYAHHFLSRRVTAHDLVAAREGRRYDLPLLAEGETVADEVLPEVVLRGKRIFYAAADRRMSRDGYVACVSCHPDGGQDGRVWDFTNRGEGLRNTIDLRGRAGTGHGPLHWSANFDEIQDFEHDIRDHQGGIGFMADADFSVGTRDTPLGDPKAGVSPDLDALAAYVASLSEVPTAPDMGDVSQGAALFDSAGCDDCHTGSEYTDSATGLRHDVGTLGDSSGSRLGGLLDGLDTPTLRGLHGTAPYLHDGRAATLREVLTVHNADDLHGETSGLSEAELDALVAFLRSLD